MKPLVSVVITTKNEEENIANCLRSIYNQSYPNIEIIVVDNFSTDETLAIVHSFKISFPSKTKGRSGENLKLKIYDHGPERSAQRNFGASKSSGKYYLYLDADMILSPCVIKECVNKFENNNLVGLYIPEIIQGNSFWNKVRRFERGFYNKTVIDCVRCVPLIVFKKIKGFDENMSGPEDWDFDKKVRQLGQATIIKSPIYHNESGFNLKKYLQKKSYYGLSFNRYIEKWGKNDSDVKKQFSPFYRFIGVFIENGKWKELIKHPVLTLSMYYLRFLVGLRFFLKDYSILK